MDYKELSTQLAEVIKTLNGIIASLPDGVTLGEALVLDSDELKEKRVKVKIISILREIGVPVHIKGYRYLLDAIYIIAEDPSMVSSITKYIYPTVAKKFNTTTSRAERAIRHAIHCVWSRGNREAIHRYFGNFISADRLYPTNSEFLALVAEFATEKEEPYAVG